VSRPSGIAAGHERRG